MERKAKIWCTGLVLLIVFLIIGSANAKDQIIGTWFGAPGVTIAYISDPINNPYTADIYYDPEFNYKKVDIAAGDISGTNSGELDRVVVRWPNGLWIYNRETNGWTRVNPYPPGRVTVGNLGQDEKLEIIATYLTGVYFFFWNGSGYSWRKITSYVPTGDIAAGDIDGDGLDEVVIGFSTGTWYWNPANKQWTKITSYRAYNLAVGDMNNDGRAEVAGCFSSGIWSWERGKWRILTGSGFVTEGDIAFGDFDGNGKDDLVSCWRKTNEIWIMWDDGEWWELPSGLPAPWRVTTGKMRTW